MSVFIQEYLPVVESIFVIIGVVFVAVQVRQHTKSFRADHVRRKKQSTIEFYNMLSTESYQFLDDIKGKSLSLVSINGDKELRKSVIRYLSRLERLAIGIASDVYDFEILCLMSGRFLSKKYEQFKTYIEEARKNKNAAMLYKEFELLVIKIEQYREKNPNQTVDKSLRIKRL